MTTATDVTATERGYCFACHTRVTFDVIYHAADGQETVTCLKCAAVGYGPAVR